MILRVALQNFPDCWKVLSNWANDTKAHIKFELKLNGQKSVKHNATCLSDHFPIGCKVKLDVLGTQVKDEVKVVIDRNNLPL